MQKKITVVGANKVYFSVLIIFLAFSYLIGIIGAILGKDITNDYFNLTVLLTQFLLILIPVLIYMFKNRVNFKEVFRFNKLEILPAALIILIAIPAIYAAGMFNSIFIFLLQFIGEIPKDVIPVPQSITQLIVGIMAIGISPAICEEALHRGIILKAYEKRGSIKAVVISAVMFGFFHFDITNLLSPIFLGILIGYYVLRTNSIFAGVLAHFIHNSILETIRYLMRNEPTSTETVISAAELGGQIIMGFAGLFFIVIFIWLFKKVTQNTAKYNPPVSSIRNDLKSILSHWPIIVSLILYVLTTGFLIFTMAMNKFLG